MADRPEHDDGESMTSAGLPAGARSMRLTKEQLAAAERTRDYHLRRLLQGRIAAPEQLAETSATNGY
jgi:hypothetical protein